MLNAHISYRSGRIVFMLFRTDYWWVRPTKPSKQNKTKTVQVQINSLGFSSIACSFGRLLSFFWRLWWWRWRWRWRSTLSFYMRNIMQKPKTYWHSCRQFWNSGICNISVLFDDFVVNGLGGCYWMLLHTSRRLASGKYNIAFSIVENIRTINGWLLRLSFCSNILVVWICTDLRRSCIRELHNWFTR